MKNYFKLLGIFIGLLCFSITSFSQNTFQGTVNNSENDKALIGALIVLEDGSLSTVSDVDGKFTFETNKSFPFKIQVSYLGFSNKEIVINSLEHITVQLNPKALIGETVVVSASRKKEKISEASSSVSVLESRKIEARSYIHPALNLHQVPGVNLSIQGTDNFQITLRGRNEAFTTETFFLQDYRTLVSPALGIAVLSRSSLMDIDIDRIEVVQGPGSALYGPGVETGVIHFLSKSAKEYPGTSFSIMGGSQNTIGVNFRQAGALTNKLSYKVLAYYQKSKDFGLDPNDPTDAISLSEFVPDIRSSLTGEILYPNINQLEENNRRYGFSAALEYQINPEATFVLSSGYAHRKGTVRAALGEAHQDHPDYYVQARYNSDDFFIQGFVNILDNNNEKGFLYRTGLSNLNKNSSYHLQAQKRFSQLTDKLDLITGAEVELSRSVTQGTVHGRYENEDDFDIYSIYAQANYSLHKNLEFIVAGRLDRFDALDNNSISPRAGLIYKASPTQVIRANYNRAVSSPQALFLFADIPFGSSPAFDIPLIGGIEAIEFDENFVTESLIPGIGSYSGLNMPLSIPYAIATDALSGSFPQEVIDYLYSKIPQVTNLSTGITILNNQPSSVLPERPRVSPSITNAFELGYKGIFGSKFTLGLDLYYNKRKDLVFVSQTSPLVLYPNIGAELSAELIRVTDEQELLALGIPQSAISEAFSSIANSLAENPLGLVEPNIAVDGALPQFVFSFYNSGSIDYFGADLSLGYYHTNDLYLYTNFSWLSKNLWNDEEIGQAGTGQTYALNVSDKRINIGFDYIPEKGLSLGASYRYQSEVEIENGTIFSGTLEAYGIADLSIGYSFNKNIMLSLTAQNLLNEKYRIMPYMPNIGRLILGKLTYSI